MFVFLVFLFELFGLGLFWLRAGCVARGCWLLSRRWWMVVMVDNGGYFSAGGCVLRLPFVCLSVCPLFVCLSVCPRVGGSGLAWVVRVSLSVWLTVGLCLSVFCLSHERQTEGWSAQQTDRQTDRQTDTDTHPDRYTHTHTHTHTRTPHTQNNLHHCIGCSSPTLNA